MIDKIARDISYENKHMIETIHMKIMINIIIIEKSI